MKELDTVTLVVLADDDVKTWVMNGEGASKRLKLLLVRFVKQEAHCNVGYFIQLSSFIEST